MECLGKWIVYLLLPSLSAAAAYILTKETLKQVSIANANES